MFHHRPHLARMKRKADALVGSVVRISGIGVQFQGVIFCLTLGERLKGFRVSGLGSNQKNGLGFWGGMV